MMKAIILASASPRRQQLLTQLGLDFQVMEAGIDEEGAGVDFGGEPHELAMELAQRKAEAAASRLTSGLVIAADTIVVCERQIMGKPLNREQARAMLRALSGRSHEVITGLCVLEVDAGGCDSAYERTRVHFRALSDQDIEAYLDSGEAMDKAGAYGIQGLGAVLVEGIEGCYYNVVGLPLTRLTMMLQQRGIKVLREKG